MVAAVMILCLALLLLLLRAAAGLLPLSLRWLAIARFIIESAASLLLQQQKEVTRYSCRAIARAGGYCYDRRALLYMSAR